MAGRRTGKRLKRSPSGTAPARRARRKDQRKRGGAAAGDGPGRYGFPVVGIGASAGGLRAFEEFFSGMSAEAEPDMAFVLVQHLAPDHKSILTELVKRYTRMDVFEVTDGMAVRPGCAYIIPPNRDMALLGGVLHLLEPSASRGQRMPIDFFFCSLAQELRGRAISIVLSGTGSDGTLGIRAVKAEGGTVFAQTPESAEFDGMPRSAISTGLVDFVVPAAEMAPRLMAYAARAGGAAGLGAPPAAASAGDDLKKLFILLRAQTGHDFSRYKPSTVNRRIDRRMALHQIGQMNDYLRFLHQNASEVEALFRDLLIGVTGFFRDPEAFADLDRVVMPRLFSGRNAGASIRVWVPGCSTGEEAYSVAILLQEHLQKCKQHFSVQVFATDIDRRAVEVARTGVYPSSIAADITPARLSRFFVPDQDGRNLRIHKGIRDMLVFSEQDLIKDPPFSRLDLICCRNVLIYMGAELQKNVIALFHYALNPGGLLFLGTSETVGKLSNLFSPLERKSKIYLREENGRGAPHLSLPGLLGPPTREITHRRIARAHHELNAGLKELMEGALLQHYAPAAAIVNARGEVLYLHGRTGRYLEIPQGEPDQNILRMARAGLGPVLGAALRKAVLTRGPVTYPGVRVMTEGGPGLVDLTVRPADRDPELAPGEGLFMMILDDSSHDGRRAARKAVATPAKGGPSGGRAAGAGAAAAPDGESQAKEEYLQTILEELEMSREEFKSTSEEMQSVNEELQSTNEELETSKEELQSVNEELSTVNTELQAKVLDLSRANNDMNNLLAGTGIGTVFVDLQLRILRFTPAAAQIINLIPTDVGRPVNHIVSNLVGYDRLVEDLRSVLDSLEPREVEVQTDAGESYSMRIQPYRTMENVIEGAVITFVNISQIKRAQESLRRLAVVVRDSNDAVTVRDLKGAILAWNPAAERLYGRSEAEALGQNISAIMPEDELRKELDMMRKLGPGGTVEPYRAVRCTKDGRRVVVRVTATALVDDKGKMYALATTEQVVG